MLKRPIVVVAAKSTSNPFSFVNNFPPNPNSPQSTINTVEREIKEASEEATAIAVDVRDFASVEELVKKTIEIYGHLDALIYNSGAIWWASVEDTPMKRFQLMQRVNPEGLYGAVQAALPHLKKSRSGGRIIVVSPPIYSRFFRGKTAYAVGKVGMSVLTKGLAMDFERQGLVRHGGRGMAVTSIWPAVSIESAATEHFVRQNPDGTKDLRKPTIFSDAILAILRAPASVVNGQLLLDEDFLREHGGIVDFSKYSVVPGSKPRRIMPAELPDLTVKEQDDEGNIHDSAKARRNSRL
ncbi:Hydroxysteroid dehydrogenase-like protein 2 [Cytospora mali]|uniref:Hydroxysteroid dehydrogenase-like protein 2 n=1 Tax=Cytospora mali TaxID=578113 RepID=A0A194VLQ1_CYTMA|nr:Hydroxysteroid dehydrogenase-like protein 2 [Valsa mali]